MKTAICFYGQPRFVKVCFERYYSKIIKHYSADVFIHTWFSDHKIGDYYPAGRTVGGSIESHELLIHEKTLSDLVEIYSPKKIKYEWYDDEIMKLDSNSVLCQYYSQREVKNLKKEYEEENNMIYDLIIRSRFDCVSSNFYDKIVDDHLNVPNTCPNPSVVTDTMSISNSKIYDDISEAYTSILEDPNLKSQIHGEYALKHQIDKCGIKVNKMSISSDVLRSNMHILNCIDF